MNFKKRSLSMFKKVDFSGSKKLVIVAIIFSALFLHMSSRENSVQKTVRENAYKYWTGCLHNLLSEGHDLIGSRVSQQCAKWGDIYCVNNGLAPTSMLALSILDPVPQEVSDSINKCIYMSVEIARKVTFEYGSPLQIDRFKRREAGEILR